MNRMRMSLTRRRSTSAPPSTQPRRRGGGGMVEQHYVIDKENRALLPGVPVQSDDFSRDMHDFFNLIVLVPIIVLNILNWNWEKLSQYNPTTDPLPVHAWHGDIFPTFFLTTAAYFLIDLLWVLLIPSCVKSPTTIVQHHIATLLYILVPYYFPVVRWAMGVCMMVEVNTWFLIARRVFNRQGFPPWTIDLPLRVSVRVKLISICFYVSWVVMRVVVYPMILWEYVGMYRKEVVMWGGWNVMGICLGMHSVFCALNLKWTFDLFGSKLRQWRAGTKSRVSSGL